MELSSVLSAVPLRTALPAALGARAISGIAYDSRLVEPGYLFAAFPGAKADGRQYAAQAMERGAVAVLSELPPPAGFDGPWIEVEHGRRALAVACRNFFGPPEQRLSLIGITGTNGKTTTTYLIDAVLRRAGKTTGVLGTIGNVLAGEFVPAVNTTPESVDLYKLFGELLRRKASHATMEVSSHALELGRAYALAFHTAVFTNLTQDHLDFHRTMDAYFAAKRRLFFANGAAPPEWAVINQDDEWARRIEPGAPTRVLTYGLSPESCVRAGNITTGFDGIAFDLHYRGARVPLRSPLVGEINVYNILAACAAGISFGWELEMIQAGIADCQAVPGRFERVDRGQPFLVIVDYAHTPDALRNAIAAARSLQPKRVLTVFGCGGDRDRSKRPLMGYAAAESSDFVVLTSDNPRGEDPLNVINDALVGLRRLDTPHRVEADRATAIRIAIQEARPGDLVLIAGKGHENYQIVGSTVIAFDDREVAGQALTEQGYRKE